VVIPGDWWKREGSGDECRFRFPRPGQDYNFVVVVDVVVVVVVVFRTSLPPFGVYVMTSCTWHRLLLFLIEPILYNNCPRRSSLSRSSQHGINYYHYSYMRFSRSKFFGPTSIKCTRVVLTSQSRVVNTNNKNPLGLRLWSYYFYP